MQVMKPPVSDVKAAPSVTDPPSPESTVARVEEGSKIVHGQVARATVGVTGLEAVDWGPWPTALDAATRKVYVVPLVRPRTRADVPGGEPVTVVAGWAVEPMNGVMV